MTNPERSLKRARTFFLSSTVLFVAFCVLESGGMSELFSPWVRGIFQVIRLLSGVFAWSLMCTAYDLRRQAL